MTLSELARLPKDQLRALARPHFDAAFYKDTYPDVGQTGVDLLTHYLDYGWKEGRNPSPRFHTAAYLTTHPALLLYDICPLVYHGAQRGGLKARLTGRFKALAPATLPEGAAAVTLSQIQLVRPFFDQEFYLESYPELQGSGIDPLGHYMLLGWIEGKDPTPDFSTGFYLSQNPDIAAQEINPFWHYHGHGKEEEARRHSAVSPQTAGILGLFEPEGALGPALAAAKALEPMIAVPHGTPAYRSPLSYPLLKQASEVLRRQFAGRRFSHVVVIPHVRMSGAARVAGQLTRALAARVGAENVLLVHTDASTFEFPQWFPEEVARLDLFALTEDSEADHRSLLLLDLLYGVEASHVFNVHSRLFWNTLQAFGAQLSQEMFVASYLFCWDMTPAQDRTGYPIEWLAKTAEAHDLILTDNMFLAEDIRQRFGFTGADAQRVVPLYTPVSLPHRRAPAAGADRPRAIWAGRHDPQKRLDVLMQIARANPQLDIWVYGKPVLGEKALAAYDPPANVFDKGAFTAFEDVLDNGFDLFLYTAGWDGIPSGLLEAGAARLPVIAPDVGGIGELVDDTTGWLIANHEDVAGYTRALAEIAANPAEAAKRSEALYARLQAQFSAARYQKDLEEALAR